MCPWALASLCEHHSAQWAGRPSLLVQGSKPQQHVPHQTPRDQTQRQRKRGRRRQANARRVRLLPVQHSCHFTAPAFAVRGESSLQHSDQERQRPSHASDTAVHHHHRIRRRGLYVTWVTHFFYTRGRAGLLAPASPETRERRVALGCDDGWDVTRLQACSPPPPGGPPPCMQPVADQHVTMHDCIHFDTNRVQGQTFGGSE